jgi:FkbM family methyltransferase
VESKDRDLANIFFDLPIKNRIVFGVNNYSLKLSRMVKIGGFIDEFSQVNSIEEVKVFKNLSEVDSDCMIINASTMKPAFISKRIKKLGFKSIHIFRFFEHSEIFDNTHNYLYEFRIDFMHFKDTYNLIRESLSDEASKKVFDIFTESRLTGSVEKNFEALRFNDGNQYLENFLELKNSNEVFIDCGAFDGNDSLNFLSLTSYDNFCYLIEPNYNNYETIYKNFKLIENYDLIKVALSDESGQLSFNLDLNTASKFDKLSQISVPTVKLDELVFTKKPTFLKMDIEGMEIKALMGGEKLLSLYKPKLAISVYHNYNDLREIFTYISKIYINYYLFMRHYTEGTDETILFVIPK